MHYIGRSDCAIIYGKRASIQYCDWARVCISSGCADSWSLISSCTPIRQHRFGRRHLPRILPGRTRGIVRRVILLFIVLYNEIDYCCILKLGRRQGLEAGLKHHSRTSVHFRQFLTHFTNERIPEECWWNLEKGFQIRRTELVDGIGHMVRDTKWIRTSMNGFRTTPHNSTVRRPPDTSSR